MKHAPDIIVTPVRWPSDRVKTPPGEREKSRFATSLRVATNNVLREVRLLGGYYPQITSSVAGRVTSSGTAVLLRGNGKSLNPAVAVYFMDGTRKCVFTCDKWTDLAANMQSIAKSIEAIRGLDRWGANMRERAMQGFLALPDPADRGWRTVLGFDEDAEAITMAKVQANYRARAREAHPDLRGGNEQWMRELNLAVEAAKKELK